MLTVPISSGPRLELVRLYLEGTGNLVWLPELEGNASASHKPLPLGAGVSVINVVNLL